MTVPERIPVTVPISLVMRGKKGLACTNEAVERAVIKIGRNLMIAS